jgi:hypothetical protein
MDYSFKRKLFIPRGGGRIKMATITISRHLGAGGATLGARLAKRLGYRYVGDELIKEVAKKAGVAPSQVRTFEKSGTSKLMKLLDWVISPDFIERHVSDKGQLSEQRYVEEIKEALYKLHREGKCGHPRAGRQLRLKGSFRNPPCAARGGHGAPGSLSL